MLFLLAVVLLNAYLAIVFKVFGRFGISSLQAIVVNYWVCVATGSVFLGEFPIGAGTPGQPWLGWSLLMGASFISIFNLIAFCTAEAGITPTSVANKLSLVIPVLFAIFLYGDRVDGWKLAGIFLAVPAVYLSSRTREKNGHSAAQKLLWPVLLFIGSGLLDTMVTWVTRQYFTTGNAAADEANNSVFLIHTFAVAGTLGTGVVAVLLATGRIRWAWKNVLAGLILGVPNYFSIYYLLRLLNSGFLQASAAIPVSNIGVVLLAGLSAIFLFREKARPARVAGLCIAVLSILLILYSDLRGGRP